MGFGIGKSISMRWNGILVWAAILGYRHEEIKHTTQQWTDFIYPDDREKAWQSIQNVLAGRSSIHKIEYRMIHKNGSLRWILDHAKVVQRDQDGRPIRMSGTHADINERKAAEEELRIAAAAFESQEGMICHRCSKTSLSRSIRHLLI